MSWEEGISAHWKGAGTHRVKDQRILEAGVTGKTVSVVPRDYFRRYINQHQIAFCTQRKKLLLQLFFKLSDFSPGEGLGFV